MNKIVKQVCQCLLLVLMARLNCSCVISFINSASSNSSISSTLIIPSGYTTKSKYKSSKKESLLHQFLGVLSHLYTIIEFHYMRLS